MMEFTVNGCLRHGFGFANPNHAAAAICALFPFCRRWRGGGRGFALRSAGGVPGQLAGAHKMHGDMV